MTSDIFLSGAACTPGLTASQMVQSSSENDTIYGSAEVYLNVTG